MLLGNPEYKTQCQNNFLQSVDEWELKTPGWGPKPQRACKWMRNHSPITSKLHPSLKMVFLNHKSWWQHSSFWSLKDAHGPGEEPYSWMSYLRGLSRFLPSVMPFLCPNIPRPSSFLLLANCYLSSEAQKSTSPLWEASQTHPQSKVVDFRTSCYVNISLNRAVMMDIHAWGFPMKVFPLITFRLVSLLCGLS